MRQEVDVLRHLGRESEDLLRQLLAGGIRFIFRRGVLRRGLGSHLVILISATVRKLPFSIILRTFLI